MKLWLLLVLLLLPDALVRVTGQQPPKNKHPKEPGENKIKPSNKKVKPKLPKIKDRDSPDATPKTQSIMMQVMDKGRFQKPAATLSLMAGQTLELRYKGNKIGWSYSAYLDTFKDSCLRVKQQERYGQLVLVTSTAADTGEFSCWAQLCHGYVCRRDEGRTGATYILFPVPSGPPATTIMASSNRVRGGDDVCVLCTVLWEPDTEVEFRWIYPGQKIKGEAHCHLPGTPLLLVSLAKVGFATCPFCVPESLPHSRDCVTPEAISLEFPGQSHNWSWAETGFMDLGSVRKTPPPKRISALAYRRCCTKHFKNEIWFTAFFTYAHREKLSGAH